MKRKRHHFLRGSSAYLSGPMDFVADRATEKRCGWRVRMKQFLGSLGVRVFDPWEKPLVRGLHEYGREDTTTIKHRDRWTFAPTDAGAKTRGELAEFFWPTMHIDLRMVDLSDFVVAYCPTNIYSVGTVHEIVVARQQHKPVLLVSPAVELPAWQRLEEAVSHDRKLQALLHEVCGELPVKRNPAATPSLWYMSLVGSQSFFDGFGFHLKRYHRKFPGWRQSSPLDLRETARKPRRPLLPYLAELATGKTVPKKWDHTTRSFGDDDDWLLLEVGHDLAGPAK